MQYLAVRWMRPAVVAILAAAVVAALIVLIGRLMLSLHVPGMHDELRRVELWVGVALTLAILLGAAFLASRPRGSMGPLERDVVIGSRPMTGELALPPVDPAARLGPVGTREDLANGFTLYARSGAVGEVADILHGVVDVGDQRRTLIYARGVHGAVANLWIPIEAVSAVYPESKSAFLAIAGDELEALGWDRPPASFVRKERPKETPLY